MTLNESSILFPLHYAVKAFENYCCVSSEDFSLERGWQLKTWLLKTLTESEINIVSFKINTVLFIIGLLLISVPLYLVAIMLYKTLGHNPSFNERLISIVYEVHQIAGSLNPPTEKIKHCIQLLNQCPSLINHPMPPYNFTPFLRACWSGNTPLVRYMLQNKADLQSCLTSGESPFYLAAYRVSKTKMWDPSVINLLYSAGCKLSGLNGKGCSALHQAARAGNVTLTQWLLSHNAHHTLQHSRVTPYDIATKYRDTKHQSIACLLHTFCPEMVKEVVKNPSHNIYL